jgi:hypothetical protein
VVAVALAACSSTPTPRYEPADLRAIELRAADAPAGLGFVPRFSGDQDLEAFARDAQERSALQGDGFELGSGAVFVPADRVDADRLRVRDPIVQETVAVFARDDGASATLERYMDDLRNRQLRAIRTGLPEPLGDETYRLDAQNTDGATVTVIGWRRANLVLVVIGTSFPPSSVVALARLVDARAAGAA